MIETQKGWPQVRRRKVEIRKVHILCHGEFKKYNLRVERPYLVHHFGGCLQKRYREQSPAYLAVQEKQI